MPLPPMSRADGTPTNAVFGFTNMLMKLIEDIGFDTSFSFIYSARPGTPAADITDEVPESVKKQRLHILQARIAQQAQQSIDTAGMLAHVNRAVMGRQKILFDCVFCSREVVPQHSQ